MSPTLRVAAAHSLPPRLRDPYSSVALEHLIVARGTTACGFGTVGIDGTVGIERWGGARGDGVSLWAAARDFLFPTPIAMGPSAPLENGRPPGAGKKTGPENCLLLLGFIGPKLDLVCDAALQDI